MSGNLDIIPHPGKLHTPEEWAALILERVATYPPGHEAEWVIGIPTGMQSFAPSQMPYIARDIDLILEKG